MAWSKNPPAHKRNVKPCIFLTATWTSRFTRKGENVCGFWVYELWEIQWNPEDEYWMLLRGDDADDEWGDIVEDFPKADYYMTIPVPRRRPKK